MTSSNTGAELFIEFFSEEIPARFQARACETLRRVAWKQLVAMGVVGAATGTHEEPALETFVTSRRLVLWMRGLPRELPAVTEELKGPKVTAPSQALAGFVKKTGLSEEALERRTLPQGDFWFAKVTKPAQRVVDLWPAWVRAVVAGMTWPEDMRWGACGQEMMPAEPLQNPADSASLDATASLTLQQKGTHETPPQGRPPSVTTCEGGQGAVQPTSLERSAGEASVPPLDSPLPPSEAHGVHLLDANLTWVRPLRSLFVVFDGQVVPITLSSQVRLSTSPFVDASTKDVNIAATSVNARQTHIHNADHDVNAPVTSVNADMSDQPVNTSATSVVNTTSTTVHPSSTHVKAGLTRAPQTLNHDVIDDGLAVKSNVILQCLSLVKGHRFLGDQGFQPLSFGAYCAGLKDRGVMLDEAARRAEIIRQVQDVEAERGWFCLEEDIAENGLIGQVVGLVEWPRLVVVPLQDMHTRLPFEVLHIVLKQHMKCFALRDAEGRTAPAFAVVTNLLPQVSDEAAIKGFARVAAARLEDARFFLDEDRKQPLTTHREALAARTLFTNLGTFFQKTQRLEQLARDLYSDAVFAAPLAQAAALCKADLATHIVNEFPELHGMAGCFYADAEGMNTAVGQAIEQHAWLHTRAEGFKDLSPAGAMLGFLDRLDSLYGFFALGHRPTGSKDPLALRRLGNGIVALLGALPVETVELPALLVAVHAAYQAQGLLCEASDPADDMHTFLDERMRFVLEKERGISPAHVAFGVGAQGLVPGDLKGPCVYTQAVAPYLASAEAKETARALGRLPGLVTALGGVNQPGGAALATDSPNTVDTSLFEHADEAALYKTYQDIVAHGHEGLTHEERLLFVKKIHGFVRPIDTFLASVMVVAERFDVKENRRRLLAGIWLLASRAGDWESLG